MSDESDWQKKLDDRHPHITQDNDRVDAYKIITTIPGCVVNACNCGRTEARIFERVRLEDVAGTSDNRVDTLFDQRGERALHRNDLAGRGSIIIGWCRQNGLEMFLRRNDIGLHKYEYDMYVRPS